jgi:hypothetical protein
MLTSGTYNFGSPQSKDIIEDAYERIGIIPTKLTQQKIDAAQRSLNFILQQMVNKGNNLWTIRHGIIQLNENQNAYNLPPNGIDIKTAAVRQSNRNLGGIAYSSAGGNAASAFDYNSSTSCTQTTPNGYISYNWGAAQFAISMVGIQSAQTVNYTLACEWSLDNINWTTALTIPSQTYEQGVLNWFVIPVPTPANVFRVREVDSVTFQSWNMISDYTWSQAAGVTWGAWQGTTLNVEELYFNTNLYDLIITRFSEFEYTSQPYKNTPGRPTSFWVDRQINPVIYLWPTPLPPWNCLYFTYWEALQDIGAMMDSAEVPARFLEPLCSALAYSLAKKEAALNPAVMQLLPQLKSDADEAYRTAGSEDRERVPLRIYGDYLQGYSTI